MYSDDGTRFADSNPPDLCRIFIELCHMGTLFLIQNFANHPSIKDKYTVQPVFRDRNHPGVSFMHSQIGDCATYWMASGDGGHWLLPRPMSVAAFEEIDPRVYSYPRHLSPRSITYCRPARLLPAAGRIEVAAKGELK